MIGVGWLCHAVAEMRTAIDSLAAGCAPGNDWDLPTDVEQEVWPPADELAPPPSTTL